jgi:hypothetical protein
MPYEQRRGRAEQDQQLRQRRRLLRSTSVPNTCAASAQRVATSIALHHADE